MKILHTADIHLGVKNLKLSKDKQALLRDEVVFNIRNFFNIAKNNNYEVVLICGDLFHTKTVSNKLVKAFFDGVERFGFPVIYVSGNHDEDFIMPSIMPKNTALMYSKINIISP